MSLGDASCSDETDLTCGSLVISGIGSLDYAFNHRDILRIKLGEVTPPQNGYKKLLE